MDHGFLRVAVASPEIKVADPDYNAGVIIDSVKAAADCGAELVALPELCITASTCGDLFLQSELMSGAERALAKVAQSTADCGAVVFVGLPVCSEGKLYNVCAVLQRGKILALVPKTCFSGGDSGYFVRSVSPHTVKIAGQICNLGQAVFTADCGVTVGVEIGEDLCAPVPPSSDCAALVTVNISADSEQAGKAAARRVLVKSQSLRTDSAYIYANAGAGESTTDAAFAGHAMIAEAGEILAENKPFACEKLAVADIDTDYLAYLRRKNCAVMPDGVARTPAEFTLTERRGKLRREVCRLPFVSDSNEDCELILNIQAQGLMKRMQASGAKKLVLGVSGGLDSSLALLVCLRALDIQGVSRKNLIAVSMPGFGTTEQTAENALLLAKESGADHRIIDIKPSVTRHLGDIGHPLDVYDAAYENAQARMRTVILMDIANGENGLAVGTGDLSEAALGWCTYNGDHMSMYGVNASVPKTQVRKLTAYEAERIGGGTKKALEGVLGTDISPELLPARKGKIAQKTEDLIGSFELNDFLLYYAVKRGCSPEKTLMYAAAAFGGKEQDYAEALARFYKRFFASQFKRSCSPDGANTDFSLSPRGAWRMPSDASVNLWLSALENKD